MTLTTYYNFDLPLTRAVARCKAIVVHSPTANASIIASNPAETANSGRTVTPLLRAHARRLEP